MKITKYSSIKTRTDLTALPKCIQFESLEAWDEFWHCYMHSLSMNGYVWSFSVDTLRFKH